MNKKMKIIQILQIEIEYVHECCSIFKLNKKIQLFYINNIHKIHFFSTSMNVITKCIKKLSCPHQERRSFVAIFLCCILSLD